MGLEELRKEVEELKKKRQKEEEEIKLKKELWELKHPNISSYKNNFGKNIKEIGKNINTKPNKSKKSKKKVKKPYDIFDF